MTASTAAAPLAPPAQVPRLPLMITAFAITAANFMNVLDLTIAVVAVPSISGTLGASPSQGTWILTIYSVCLAIVLPLTPWVCKRYGEVLTFTFSVMMFSLTSWACGLSTNMEMLVFFRALQGLSSGLIVPLSQTVLLRIFPPEKHGMAIGLWSIASTIAPVLGPVLGGVADALSAGPDGDEQPTTSSAIPTRVPRSALAAVISRSSVLETFKMRPVVILYRSGPDLVSRRRSQSRVYLRS